MHVVGEQGEDVTITQPYNILQYFKDAKIENFPMKKGVDFLIFAQNIDCE